MRILIVAPGEYTGDDLDVGMEYEAVPAEYGTEAQNRAWHALIQEYWRSGCHSYNARSFEHFRALIKLYLGAGMEKFINLIDEHGKPCPGGRIDYRLKSWKDYTKKERKKAIDNLISEMVQAGADTPNFQEIIKGMEKVHEQKTTAR